MTKRHGAERLARIMLAAGLLLASWPATAQLRITGLISGTVQDPTGAAVPRAKVTLRDEATGVKKEAETSEAGAFTFPDLAHGSYEITVSHAGFSTTVVSKVTVSTSQTTDVPVRLELGQQAQTVTVEGASPVLETVSQLVTTTAARQTVLELPVLNRSNVLALARLAPGASPPGGGSTRYNNLPGGAVNVTIDGINNASNGYKSGGTVFYQTVPMRVGALEELSVETSGLGADSGAQSGANIKFVTRRGGSEYHGSVFYEPRSEQFNANTWSRNANPQTAFRVYSRQHDYGGNVGGPLVPFGRLRNKLFFFANYEQVYSPRATQRTIALLTPEAQRGIYTYLVSGTTNVLRTVNVLQLAGANGAPAQIDAVARSIMELNNKAPSGAVQIPDSDFNRDSYVWSAENNLYQYFPTTRIDYQLTPKHQLTFTWNYYHSWQPGERRLPLEEVNRTNPFRLGYFIWAGAVQSSFTARTFNEFRYGVQHSGDTNAYAPNGLFNTSGGKPLRIGAQLPFGTLTPFIDQQNVTGRHYITTMYDTATLLRGKHTVTIGGSYRATDWKDAGEVFPIPTYTLGTPTGDPLPGQLFTQQNMPGIVNTDTGNASGAAALYNQLTGRVAQANLTRVVDPETFRYDGFINWTWTRSYMGGAFVQDRWRISPGFTLNYGLRWEAQGQMYDVKGITAAPDLASLLGPSVAPFTPGVMSGNNDPQAQVGRRAYRPDWLNFAPNLGFSWNPNAKEGWRGKILGGNRTVIRSSFSVVVYDEGTQMFAQNLGPNAGKTVSANLVAGQSVLPRFTTLSDVATAPPAPGAFPFARTEYAKVIRQADQTFRTTLNGINPDLRTPYTVNWTLGVQREIARGTVVEARYVGNQAQRAWRTMNLNEVNIFENGFLEEFKNAQKNLALNRSAGVQSFANRGLAGQAGLPIFETAFGPRGAVAALPAGSGFQSATFLANLDNGGAGALATALATNRDYVCRMLGNRLPACETFVNAGFNTPGPYPLNVFLMNPFVAGRMNYVDDTGWNNYHGLQIQLRKQYASGLTWNANYTWSKSLTTLARDTANQNLDLTTRRNRALDKMVSPFDIRHVVQTFGTYELPWGKGRRWSFKQRAVDGILGGWTAGSILVLSGGQPIQITGGGFGNVNNSDNPLANGVRLAQGVALDEIRSMFSAPLTRVTGRAGAVDTMRLAVDPRLVGADGRANPAYLALHLTPGEFGQALFVYGRNTFNWDTSLTKRFQLREKIRFELFAGAGNVLNHPAWGMGSASIFSTSFGIVNGATGSRTMNFRGTLSF